MGADAIVVGVDAARALGCAVLEALGAPRRHARKQVDILIEGDLRGRASHGIQRLPTLVDRIRNGVLDPRAVPRIDRRSASIAVVDGLGGFGPLAADAALGYLRAAAASAGIASAAVRNAGHVGMLACYLEELCRHGLIAVAFTTSEALVHPAGGRTALIGTNPIGIGIPLGAQPLILDMSTAAVSAGEIIAHAKRGARLAPGRAIDAAGHPTTDPDAALAGAISPFGGAKGYGLGLAIELVVALVSGTAVGEDVRGTLDTEHPSTKGDLFIAIDPDVFGVSPDDAEYLAEYLQQVRAAPRAPGVDRILVPGDRMREERARGLVNGLQYPPALWDQLRALEQLLAGADG